MNEKDFVTAWLLAARAADSTTTWTEAKQRSLLIQAQQTYRQIETAYKQESKE